MNLLCCNPGPKPADGADKANKPVPKPTKWKYIFINNELNLIQHIVNVEGLGGPVKLN